MITIKKNQVSIPVLAVGQGWLIVDKPSEISIHNEPGKDLCSILTSYIEANAFFRRQLSYDATFGLHAVQRLDKQTSGVTLFACRRDIFRHFSRQFEDRSVRKRYVAILHGKLRPSESEDKWGLWDWPLSKNAGGRMAPVGKGKIVECQTRFRILRQSAHYTLIECEPLTGRKHQIRRHAKLARHPIVGDQRYGTRRSLKYLKDHCGFTRLGLHAMAIMIRPPGKTRPETIQSQGIPLNMQHLFDKDQAG